MKKEIKNKAHLESGRGSRTARDITPLRLTRFKWTSSQFYPPSTAHKLEKGSSPTQEGMSPGKSGVETPATYCRDERDVVGVGRGRAVIEEMSRARRERERRRDIGGMERWKSDCREQLVKSRQSRKVGRNVVRGRKLRCGRVGRTKEERKARSRRSGPFPSMAEPAQSLHSCNQGKLRACG